MAARRPPPSVKSAKAAARAPGLSPVERHTRLGQIPQKYRTANEQREFQRTPSRREIATVRERVRQRTQTVERNMRYAEQLDEMNRSRTADGLANASKRFLRMSARAQQKTLDEAARRHQAYVDNKSKPLGSSFDPMIAYHSSI
jgi:hypothetical protein